jgi:hypothetical protein
MTTSSSFPALAIAARAAFLRGIEHRGVVLAQAQCDGADGARAAMAATERAFHQQAAAIPASQWPSLFWELLLEQPTMRAELVADPRNPFSQLGAGPRAALLLRLVAGLDQLQGADVLHVPVATYRHALYRALEILRSRGMDESALQLVRDSLQRDAKPAHAAAVSVATPVNAADDEPEMRSGAVRWIRPGLIVVAGVLLLTFVGSFFWLPEFLKTGGASPDGFQTLRAHAPAATISAAASAISNPDFEQLTDPQGERIARDLDLYAWFAATSNTPVTSAIAGAPLPETTLPETAAPEADAEDPSEGASTAADAPLPVVPGHSVDAHASSSKQGDDHAH